MKNLFTNYLQKYVKVFSVLTIILLSNKISHKGQNMKKLVYGSLIAAAVLFSGCGGGGGGGGTADTTAPVFNNPPANNTYTLAEGSTDVATIEVTDDSEVTFSLGGDDADAFELTPVQTRAIYSTTLRFKTAPDFETKNEYHVSVTAKDSAGNSDTKEFTVSVTDVPFGFASSVPSTVSTVVGTPKTITLADNGEGNETTTFTLVDGANGAFTFDNNVTLTFNPGSAGTYVATVRATNGGVSVDKNITGTAVDAGSGEDPGAYTTIGTLDWQNSAHAPSNWNDANDYCQGLSPIGSWHLPSAQELGATFSNPDDSQVQTIDPNNVGNVLIAKTSGDSTSYPFSMDQETQAGFWLSDSNIDANGNAIATGHRYYYSPNGTIHNGPADDNTDSGSFGRARCVKTH